MTYVNANAILPERLITEIQKYVQGETIYVPKHVSAHQKWGERSGTRHLIDDRNDYIKLAFKNSKTITQLAEEHHLSIETIKKIVYAK